MEAELTRIFAEAHHSSRGELSYNEKMVPENASQYVDDIFLKSGISHEMLRQASQSNDTKSMQRYLSTVFTKENIQALGFHNLILQIRQKIGHKTQLPTCEIRMNNVNYSAKTRKSDAQIKTVITPFSCPTIGRSDKVETRYVLRNINAIFKPGTMTLVNTNFQIILQCTYKYANLVLINFV